MPRSVELSTGPEKIITVDRIFCITTAFLVGMSIVENSFENRGLVNERLVTLFVLAVNVKNGFFVVV